MTSQLLTLLFFWQALELRGIAIAVQLPRCSLDDPNAASCIPLNVSVNPLCVENAAACNGSADVIFPLSKQRQCSGGSSDTASKVSHLVMVAIPQCNPSHYYNISALWENTNSDYMIVLRDLVATNTWSSHIACVYNGHTATFTNHEIGGHGKIRTQVVTQNIERSVNYSVYDVIVETSLPRLGGDSTYAVYNDTRGRSCEQLYSALSGDKIRAAANWDGEVGGTVEVEVQWCDVEASTTNSDLGYIVDVGSGSCTAKDRNPPCFFVQNSSRVSIGPFSWHREADIPVRVYRVNTTYCANPQVKNSLVHLFRGCDTRDCCSGGVTVPTLNSDAVSTVSAAGSGVFTTTSFSSSSSQTTPCFTDTSVSPSSSSGQDPSSPPDGSHSGVTKTTSSSTDSLETVNSLWITLIAVAVAIVILGTVLSLITVTYYFASKRKMSKSSLDSQSKKHKPPPLATTSVLDVIVDNEGGHASSQGAQLLTSHGQSSHVSTPTSVESSEPLLHDSSTKHVALVVYSSRAPEKNQEMIRNHLLSELQSYGIEARSHDLTCIKTSPSLWLEREITKATIVLCVCNKEFKEDWECPQSAPTSLPLVQSLRHMIAATVNQGKDLSKYAVVLLEPADRNCVPTMYLQSDSRQFMIDDVDAIARFVCDVPTHITSSS